MGVYKRGQTYWYKFLFEGQLIRESAETNSKIVAREAERARRRDLELGFNRISKRERRPLFNTAVTEWLATKTALSRLGRVYYEQYSRKLMRQFGDRVISTITVRVISTITVNDVAALQQKRLDKGLSARSVNCEIATLRQILKHWGCWTDLAGRIRFLRESIESGRALLSKKRTDLLERSRRVLRQYCTRCLSWQLMRV
jgi:hypothetical protein